MSKHFVTVCFYKPGSLISPVTWQATIIFSMKFISVQIARAVSHTCGPLFHPSCAGGTGGPEKLEAVFLGKGHAHPGADSLWLLASLQTKTNPVPCLPILNKSRWDGAFLIAENYLRAERHHPEPQWLMEPCTHKLLQKLSCSCLVLPSGRENLL